MQTQVRSTSSLSNSKQAEGEAIALLAAGEVPHELLHHPHGLPLAVADQAGHTLGNVSPTLLVDSAPFPPGQG